MNFLSIFLSVFLAELGDKTQLATLLFATDGKISPTGVFFASAGALVLSSLIAVAAGTFAKEYLANPAAETDCRHRLHRHRRLDAVRLFSRISRFNKACGGV